MHLASHPPSVRSPGAHQMLAGLVFQRHGGLTEPLSTQKTSVFLATYAPTQQKLKFSIGTDVARSSLCPGRPRFASRIAFVATPGAHQVVAGILLCIRSVQHDIIDPSIHPASPTLIHSSILASMHTLHYASPYVYSDLACIMLWVAGGNCISNNHPLVTLPYLTLPYLTLP